MFLRQARLRNLVIAGVILASLFLSIQDCIAEPVSIKGTTKIQRMGSYVILINYETRDEWTDNLLFKVHCKFDKKEFTYVSSSYNDIERGWHKTEVTIPDVVRKRYGPLREYRIDLYHKGILVDTKKSY